MAQLHRLEDPENREVGGALVVYPSGYRQQLAWRGVKGTRVDPQEMGKELATQALQGLLDRGLGDDVGRTNWVSMSAGLGRVVSEWSERRNLQVGGGDPGERPAG